MDPAGPVDNAGDRGPVAVLVVDDQEAFRAAARELIAAASGFTLAGEASSGEAALEAADRLSPRLVIIDKRMPGMGGVEATRMLKARHPDLVVLLVSVEEPHAQLMHDCGADAFVRKQQLTAGLLTEVWQAHGSYGVGGRRVDPGADDPGSQDVHA